MYSYECSACGDEGALEPDDALARELVLLAESANGDLMCLVCYAQSESVCLHCGIEDGIFPDTSCNAEPWLCRDCLALPYRIHMFSCYLDGCMTVEEFSAECLREIEFDEKMEQEKDKHGDHPWRSC